MTPLLTAVDFRSPSLGSPGGGAGPAYELKFLLDEEWAQAVEAWARRRLAPDPHGDPALGGAYRTTSLYCDTPELDVYHGNPSYRRSKYRVRCYGAESLLYLERKSKWGDRVAKRRTAVPPDESVYLASPLPDETWPGFWFHSRLLQRRLSPACRITYQRSAYAGASADGPVRLTLDRHVRGILLGEWSLAPVECGRPLLLGQVILEFKFSVALPVLFKELVQSLRLSPSGVSKYRQCRRAWGVPVWSGLSETGSSVGSGVP